VALTGNDLIANNLYQLVYVAAGPYYIVTNPSGINTQGANVASATTINLDTATGDYVHITGTTTITAITLSVGREKTVVFDGSLILTNGGSLLLPGAANITTSAGDTAIFRGEESGVVRCINYEQKGNITGFVAGDKIYLNVDGGSTTYIDLDSVVTESQFESVGPTGSLANNIWTAMDVIPLGAKAVYLMVNITMTNTSNAVPVGGVFARRTGSSASASDATVLAAYQGNVTAATGTTTGIQGLGWVPLDTSNRFDIHWSVANDTSRNVTLALKGFLM
jgi:hypothetical protein